MDYAITKPYEIIYILGEPPHTLLEGYFIQTGRKKLNKIRCHHLIRKEDWSCNNERCSFLGCTPSDRIFTVIFRIWFHWPSALHCFCIALFTIPVTRLKCKRPFFDRLFASESWQGETTSYLFFLNPNVFNHVFLNISYLFMFKEKWIKNESNVLFYITGVPKG